MFVMVFHTIKNSLTDSITFSITPFILIKAKFNSYFSDFQKNNPELNLFRFP